MSSKPKIHSLRLVNASAIAALSCVRDSKTFDNPLDMLNAGAISAVILKRLPALKDSRIQPQAIALRKVGADGKDTPMTGEEVEEWFAQPFEMRLTETMRDTLKKAVEKHVKDGALVATEGVTLLLTELGLGEAVNIDALVADETGSV